MRERVHDVRSKVRSIGGKPKPEGVESRSSFTESYTHCVQVSLLAYAQVGAGRRLHIVDCTKVEVPLDSGHYECSGVVKNDGGSLARGYKLATHPHALGYGRGVYPGSGGADSSP